MTWMEANLHRELSIAEVAAHAKLSSRTLSRRFREETGSTPVQYLTRARVRFAQTLLETTAASIDRIAHEVGFGSAENLRVRFAAALHTTPAAYRKAFRGSGSIRSVE